MRRAAALAVVCVALAAAVAAVAIRPEPPVVVARPGRPFPAVPAGSVVVLAPGTHRPFLLDRAATVRARPGAVVEGPVRVAADGARLESVRVRGGESGIVVRDADRVVLDRVEVHGAELHGIEVVDASVSITGCRVTGLKSTYAQGIEVRNATNRPRTRIRGCSVFGGQEGIVSHVARVEVRGNTVAGSTLRGIAVTEMSEGLAAGNTVRDAAGAGLYCGDMSHCEFRGNDVADVRDPGGAPLAASGPEIVAWYHSTMRARDNRLGGEGEVLLLQGSVTVDRFPLAVWPEGWRGVLPAIPVAGVALGGMLLVRVAVGRFLRRGHAPPVRPVGAPGALVAAVVAGLAVQAFHMVEHVVQVWQVTATAGEHTSGLLGRDVDTEWLHLAFNLSVFAFAAVLLVLTGPRRGDRRSSTAWLATAVAIQTWHVAEHVAKVVQHEAHGIRVAPGLLGHHVGLVWFHFGINLAVTAATLIGVARLFGLEPPRLRLPRPVRRSDALEPAR